MFTFTLLAVFAMIGMALAFVAYSANQRRRAGMSGVAAVHYRQVSRPRATPKNF